MPPHYLGAVPRGFKNILEYHHYRLDWEVADLEEAIEYQTDVKYRRQLTKSLTATDPKVIRYYENKTRKTIKLIRQLKKSKKELQARRSILSL